MKHGTHKRTAHSYHAAGFHAPLEEPSHPLRGDPRRTCHQRGLYFGLLNFVARLFRLFRLPLLGRVRHGAAHLDSASEHRAPAVRRAGARRRVQDALLEPRRQRSGAHGLPCVRYVHVLSGRHAARCARVPHHVCRKRRGRRGLGGHSRCVQGVLQYQRVALHADDELYRDVSRRVLHRALVSQRHGRHAAPDGRKPSHLGGRADGQEPSDHSHRRPRHRAHLLLSALLQTRL